MEENRAVPLAPTTAPPPIASLGVPVFDYATIFQVETGELEEAEGLYRWRIENMCPALIETPTGLCSTSHENRRQFYTSDCYLVLHCTGTAEEDLPPSALYYWVGKEASVDKIGAMCFRAVQLSSLAGGVNQHREDQESESSEFLDLYNNDQEGDDEEAGIEYLEGGTETAFKKVEARIKEFHSPRLYKLKTVGDEIISLRVGLKEKMLEDSAAVFLMDTGGVDLFLLPGFHAPKNLCFQAHDLALLISVNERESKAVVHQLDFKSLTPATLEQSPFWSFIKPPQESFSAFCAFWKPFEAERQKEQEKQQNLERAKLARLYLEEKKFLAAMEEIAIKQKLDSTFQPPKTPEEILADIQKDSADIENKNKPRKAVNEEKAAKTNRELDSKLCQWILYEIVAPTLGEMDVNVLWEQMPNQQNCLKPNYSLVSHKPKSTFVLDCGGEMYVYYPSEGISFHNRQVSFILAKNICDDDTFISWRECFGISPDNIDIHEIQQSKEPVLFQSLFSGWLEAQSAKNQDQIKVDFRSKHQVLLDNIACERRKFIAAGGSPEKFNQTKSSFTNPTNIDIHSIFPENRDSVINEEKGIEESWLHDEIVVKEGTCEVGILTSRKELHLDAKDRNHFSSHNCYLLIRTFYIQSPKIDIPKTAELGKKVGILEKNGTSDVSGLEQRWKIYFWQGRDSGKLKWATFSLGLLPLLQANITQFSAPPATVQRIFQGEEPAEFLKLFAPRHLIIRNGPNSEITPSSQRVMFKINAKGSAIFLNETEECTLLTSRAFIMGTESHWFLWKGKLWQKQEQLFQEKICFEDLCGLYSNFCVADQDGFVMEGEGSESERFWGALGERPIKTNLEAPSVRLASMSFQRNEFCVVEVPDFTERVLVSNNAYLLMRSEADQKQIYLWIGNQVTERMKKCAEYVASKFSATFSDSAFVSVEDGNEEAEPKFVSCFPDWSRKAFVDPYAAQKKRRLQVLSDTDESNRRFIAEMCDDLEGLLERNEAYLQAIEAKIIHLEKTQQCNSVLLHQQVVLEQLQALDVRMSRIEETPESKPPSPKQELRNRQEKLLQDLSALAPRLDILEKKPNLAAVLERQENATAALTEEQLLERERVLVLRECAVARNEQKLREERLKLAAWRADLEQREAHLLKKIGECM
eukprot:TRINITY_DN578_c0_g1_i1.p1 TRINITY_DN578_c0_g1~~TRINITY_DN578_c0_g1_i1.p1  ORF type:complete len:1261 (+),score=255.13 TRINITY_DN578_c0_g1_i1:332-3784(+)